MEPLKPTYADPTTPQPQVTEEPLLLIPAKVQWACAPVVFGLLTLAMFADVLFTSGRVISHVSTDLSMQFLPWREFGFGQIKQGNFPMWNPHAYGGQPYFAGFQSALLYPPNWLHLIMSVPMAINWIVALHVFALGYFMYFWCRGRGIGISGSILAGVMVMFCGPYFLHLYAGHLPHLAIIVWAPLMLLALDKLAATGSILWALLGVLVTSMEILAGHPQYVYYTGITLSIYVMLLMIHSPRRMELAGGFVLMYVGAVLVTAVQLLTGLQAASEFVRSGGTSYEFASTFSLPWENLLTLFVPTFFENIVMNETGAGMPYWGAGYLWELSLFISISGLMLAILGAVRARRPVVWILPTMVGITLMLALGRNTFLYRPMFDFFPGYASFRGTVKFAYLCVMFTSVLAAMGLDSLLANRRVATWFIAGVAGLGIFGLVMGAGISFSKDAGPQGAWGRFVGDVIEGARKAHDNYNRGLLDARKVPEFLSQIGQNSAQYTYLAGGTLLLVAALLWASRFHRLIPYSLLMLACIEMFCFARGTRATMDPTASRAIPAPWADSLSQIRNNPDMRVLIASFDETLQFWARGMYYGFDNLSGNDPGVLRRYAELMFAAAKVPGPVNQYIPVTDALVQNIKVMRLLRCPLVYYALDKPPGILKAADAAAPEPLPVASLFSEWVRIEKSQDALATTAYGQYDPAKIVIVEDSPDVQMMPAPNSPGTLQIVSRTTDSLEFQVDLQRNAILLVTNNYSTGWNVWPIESEQRDFKVIPANYSQIGIPLRAGKHHFTLEYSPLAFRIGRWISIFSILGLGAWAIWLMRASFKDR